MRENHTSASYPELQAQQLPPEALVVFLHGLGSDGYDLISLASLMQSRLSVAHFISPHGLEEYDMAPFGYQWFSLKDREPAQVYKLATKSLPMVMQIIREKQQELGLSNKQTVIIGFSQGTMMGLYLNLVQQDPFAAVVGFSGRLITPEKCVNITTPICLIHGELDEIVTVRELHNITSYLNKHAIPHQTHILSNLAHSIDARGIEIAIGFIKDQLKI